MCPMSKCMTRLLRCRCGMICIFIYKLYMYYVYIIYHIIY